MARTTITISDHLLQRAAALGVNVSEAARLGVELAVERAATDRGLDELDDRAATRPLPVAPGDLAAALAEVRGGNGS